MHDVLWEDPAAAILRASMAAEIRGRYADRLHDPSRRPAILDPIDPDSVSYTAVATVDGEPVGHLALRRLRGDVDLKQRPRSCPAPRPRAGRRDETPPAGRVDHVCNWSDYRRQRQAQARAAHYRKRLQPP